MKVGLNETRNIKWSQDGRKPKEKDGRSKNLASVLIQNYLKYAKPKQSFKKNSSLLLSFTYMQIDFSSLHMPSSIPYSFTCIVVIIYIFC